MRALCSYCVKKPITVLMCVLIIIVGGLYSLTKTTLSLIPNVNLPYAVIVTTYVGANPEDVEKEVTVPIEKQLSAVSNYSSMYSTSYEHYSMIVVEFADGTNMDTAFLEMRESFDAISFKDGIEKPMIMRISMDMMPIAVTSVLRTYEDIENDQTLSAAEKNEQSLIRTTNWINNELADELNAIEGISAFSMSGAADVSICLNINEELLPDGLTAADVWEVIDEENIEGLVGIALDGSSYKMLYFGNKINGLDELKNLAVYYDPVEEEYTYLKDIVSSPIDYINNETTVYNKINGVAGVTISFQQESSAQLMDAVSNVEKAMSKIEKENEGVKISYILNQGDYVEMSISTVLENLIFGAILAVIVLLLFLRKLKPTIIVAISIPTSVLATLGLMYLSGINMNLMSMGGLALGIGMLVDNSVVVIENIFRMLKEEGKTKKEAAIYGAKEVALAVTVSTITTMAVFLPIMLMDGMIGELFVDLSLTVIYSLLCSLIISLTLVPSMSARFLQDNADLAKEKKESFIGKFFHKVYDGIMNKKAIWLPITLVIVALAFAGITCIGYFAFDLNIVYSIIVGVFVVGVILIPIVTYCQEGKEKDSQMKKGYEKALRWSLGHKTITVIVAVILFLGSAILALSRGFIILPATDEGSITMTLSFEEDVEYADVCNYADETTAVILEFDDVELLQTQIGASSVLSSMMGGGSGATNSVTYSIGLKSDRENSSAKNAKMISNAVREYLTSNFISYVELEADASSSLSSFMAGSGVSIYVKGQDLHDLEDVANDLVTMLEGIDGIEKASNGINRGDDTVKITLDKEEAIKHNITNASIKYSIEKFLVVVQSLISSSSEDTIMVSIDDVEFELATSSTNNMMSSASSITYDTFLKWIPVLNREMINVLENNPDMVPYVLHPSVIAAQMAFAAATPDTPEYQAAAMQYMQAFFTQPYVINPLLLTEVGMTEDDVVFVNDGAVSSANLQTGFTNIVRDGKNRYLTVTGQFEEGYSATKVGAKVEEALQKYLDSDDFDEYRNTIKVYQDGENEEIMDSVKKMALACLIAIALVYMIMCIQFQSLKYPLIIMATIPLAFTGGFLGLLITGLETSVIALIGMIILVGIVINNGIVIIDYMNQLIESGVPVFEAIVRAGKTRLRPILMTALTTILGLLAMAIGIGEGAELMQPMAIVTIGGLFYATLLTLFVIPCIYAAFNRKKIKKEESLNVGDEQ